MVGVVQAMSWPCPTCTYINVGGSGMCGMCSTFNPNAVSQMMAQAAALGGAAGPGGAGAEAPPPGDTACGDTGGGEAGGYGAGYGSEQGAHGSYEEPASSPYITALDIQIELASKDIESTDGQWDPTELVEVFMAVRCLQMPALRACACVLLFSAVSLV